MSVSYFRSKEWALVAVDDRFYLENQYQGKLLIDRNIKKVIESSNGCTFEELDQKKLLSQSLLRTALVVLCRIGVIINDSETDAPEIKSTSDLLDCAHLVSVIIVNYNGRRHLPELLESLQNQTYRNLEILIVDNDSADSSCGYVKSFHQEVQLIEMKKNLGFARGVNLGMKRSRGDYILVLNNDTVLDVTAVYELVKAALSCDRWSAIAPKMLHYNNRAIINSLGNSIYDENWGADNFFGFVDLSQFDHFRQPQSASFGAVLLNRKVIEKIGPLDEFYKFYYEDVDWCFRAHHQGYTVFSAPSTVVYHKFGASMREKGESFKLGHVVGNRLYFSCKNLSFRVAARFVRHYIMEDKAAVKYFIRTAEWSLVRAYCVGYIRFLLSLPALMFRRYGCQKSRTGPDDSALLAKAAPLSEGLLEEGIPVLTTRSLRLNYLGIKAISMEETDGDKG